MLQNQANDGSRLYIAEADRVWLKIANQWLVKTALGDPAYKQLGRWSRWRRNAYKRLGGFELLETQISLTEMAARIGVFDQTREKVSKSLRTVSPRVVSNGQQHDQNKTAGY